MTKLVGKAALVTGGSRGIGRAIVERLALEGADIAFSYRENKLAADRVVAGLTTSGHQAMAFKADLGEDDSARLLFARAEEALGQLDILVNNAGVAPTHLLVDMSDEEPDHAIAVNLKAPFVLMREAARRLRDGGRIVNISTSNTVRVGPGHAAYASSKAALEVMSRVVAFELGERAITVNSVLPGATDTDMFRCSNPNEHSHARVMAITPLQRLGKPEDVADVVAFLVSDDARWLTGQNIRAGGGLV